VLRVYQTQQLNEMNGAIRAMIRGEHRPIASSWSMVTDTYHEVDVGQVCRDSIHSNRNSEGDCTGPEDTTQENLLLREEMSQRQALNGLRHHNAISQRMGTGDSPN